MNKKRSIILTICVLFAFLAVAGCYKPTPYPQLTGETYPSAAASLGQYRIVGVSVRNSPIMSHVFGQGPDVILIVATIHGDEPAGTPLVRRLASHLKENPHLLNGRTIVLLPVANPDGIGYNTRHNARGVDLNRNFAAANRVNSATSGRTALSEPEARVIWQLIRHYSPDRIVSIHQPLACIDYDGPALPLAARMAQYCDLLIKKLGAKPGSLGSYAGLTLEIPIVTLELRKIDSQLSTERLWQLYGKALLAAIVYPDMPQ